MKKILTAILQGFLYGTICWLAVIGGFALLVGEKPPSHKQIVVELYNEEKAIADYLKKHDGVETEVFAAACMETTNPALCAAMALVESDCRINLRNGPAGEVGPFRIIPRYWRWLVGYPSEDPYEAAQQWDIIMIHLQETNASLPSAIGAYNGNGDGYVFKVWTHYRRMEM